MTASRTDDQLLIRIRPSMPDPDEVSAYRGPIMMETVLNALHSLRAKDGQVSLEIGIASSKIGLFARGPRRAVSLLESQMYAQFPDAEIEEIPTDLLDAKEGEVVLTGEMRLDSPEVFPIKRYPQFADVVTRQSLDSIAGITGALVRYPVPGMRGHVQVLFSPIGSSYRRRALKFLPFLDRGLSKYWPAYAVLWTKVHMARGWKRLLLFPIDMLMGAYRIWFSGLRPKTQISLITGEEIESSDGGGDGAQVSMRSHEREDASSAAADKLNRLLFEAVVRISIITPAAGLPQARTKLEEIASSFRQFTLPQCNGFMLTKVRETPNLPLKEFRAPAVFSAEEVATLWHVPNILVKTPNMDWVLSKKLEPPVNLPVPGITDPQENLTILGESIFHNQRVRFGIRGDDRRRHLYVMGKTGMGKSTLLENMIFSDIHSGKGVGVIDPHGDLIEAVLRFVPKDRSNDVILFDPADRDFPVSFNILEAASVEQRPLVCSGLMGVFTKMWPDVWSGRMEHILRNTLLALLEAEGSSMLGILRMLADDPFRIKVVSHVQDPFVKAFWESEYAVWTEKYRTEAIAAIQNKIGQLLSTPLIRNIVGQVHSTLDIRHAMDTGKIVLVNLSKGRIGEDTSAFLGSMLVTKFQIDAMSRANIPEKERRDFFLYVDEFQNFVTKSFATILSEARKYRLSLTMANQYIGQLLLGDKDTSLRDAIFGNVGSLVSFQVGSDDAEELSLQFEESVTPKDILSLPKYHAYLRLMIDGIPSKPFSVSMLPPPVFKQDQNRVEVIRDLSRERYSQPRVDVEEKISRWAAGASEARVQAVQQVKRAEKEEEEKKKARAKKMSLEDYRKWRDKEMWANTFNALRKKSMLGQALTPEEQAQMQDMEKKLMASGGVPPVSKSLLEEIKRQKEGKPPAKQQEEDDE